MSRTLDVELQRDEQRTSRPGLPVDVYRLGRALQRGKGWLVLAALLGSVVGLAAGKWGVRHSYEATASIRYEGLPGQAVHDLSRDLPSLVSVTHSEPLMTTLRERMGLEDASVELLRRLVEVESDAGSGLVSFTATGESAEGAAKLANEVVDVFLDHHRQRRSAEVRALIGSLGQRIEAAEGEVRAARTRYDAFREQNHISNLTAEQEQAITQAAELRSEGDLARAEVQALEARVNQLRGSLQRTPRMEAVADGRSSDATRLDELRNRLREARSSRSDRHPEVQALQRQVASLQRQVARGGGTSTRMDVSPLHAALTTSLAETETALEGARRRSESLEALAAEAQTRTNRFSAIEGQAATLLAQVNVEQSLLDELAARRTQAEDDLRDIQTGFRTVTNAQPPESAVRSKKKLIVAAGVPLGFVTMVLALLLYRELHGFHVQTPAETAWWGNGPVIGATTWPRDSRALIDLIADMDDFAPEAKGSVLIVASTEAERELAHEIAGQLNHDWGSSALVDVPVLGALPPPSTADDDPYSDERDIMNGELYDGPAEMMLTGPYDLDGLNGADISTYAGQPQDIDDPAERLICTAWSGPSHGQALRRAARLADRVLVVVTSDAMRATALARMKKRLGREGAVGYVLVGVSDDVAKLPDRAGPIEEFWDGGSTK